VNSTATAAWARASGAAAGVAALALALGACGGSSVRPPAARQPARAVAQASAGGALVPDPMAAQSYPEPKNAPRHADAASPRLAARTAHVVHTHHSVHAPQRAGQAGISPAAPSDATIQSELAQLQAAQRSAKQAAAAQAAQQGQSGAGSVGGNGAVVAPAGVPVAVAQVIAGGNEIADFPYRWGGGHVSFVDDAYDCSGSVSYALAAGGLLNTTLTSGQLESWGDPGPGKWVTVYANAGHTFMYVDGMWFNTAGRNGPYASRWQTDTPSLAGYVVRHPPGL
jgi:cell wall-associated NlpC family hydrolase